MVNRRIHHAGRRNGGRVVTSLTCVLLATLAACATLPQEAAAQAEAIDDRHAVQSHAAEIRELLRFRPDEISPRGRLKVIQDYADQRIAEVEAARDPAYQSLVLTQRPEIRRIEPGSRFFHVPVVDFDGNTHDMVGEIPGIWHLVKLDTTVFEIAAEIALRPENVDLPDDATISNALLLGGTAAQSAVHAYPGDFDYTEALRVDAESIATAGAIVADAIVEFVERNMTQTAFEFTRLRIMPLRGRSAGGTNYNWNADRILDESQRAELARQITTTDGGRINSEWRAIAAENRFFIIGKILSIDARQSGTGEPLFRTEPRRATFQTAYFGRDVPAYHEDDSLGEFAHHMRRHARGQRGNGHYLKAAKRSFNYCRTIGDFECLDAIVPIFATPGARVYHSHKVLEAIIEALDPETPTRILTLTNARTQMNMAAHVIESSLPVVAGTLPERPAALARQIRLAATELTGGESGVLLPNPELAERLKLLDEFELVPVIELGLKDHVESVMDQYVR